MGYIRCSEEGGRKPETPTLLWTNPSPNSAYAGDSWISIPSLSDYSHLVINVKSSLANPYNKQYIIDMTDLADSNHEDRLFIGTATNTTNTSNGNFRYLQVDLSKNRMYFSNGYSTYQWQTVNTGCVPLTVYGLKDSPINL